MQVTADMDGVQESLMLQLEDALTQIVKLKADLAAANKATSTAQALLDKAAQERDAAKASAGEPWVLVMMSAGKAAGQHEQHAAAHCHPLQRTAHCCRCAGTPAALRALASTQGAPCRHARTCQPCLPCPSADELRIQASQLAAEARETSEQLSGLQETLEQVSTEKGATSEELASCRGDLSKATGEPSWMAGWL